LENYAFSWRNDAERFSYQMLALGMVAKLVVGGTDAVMYGGSSCGNSNCPNDRCLVDWKMSGWTAQKSLLLKVARYARTVKRELCYCLNIFGEGARSLSATERHYCYGV